MLCSVIIYIIYLILRLLEEIDKHPSLIIMGETGSGKTTQIPQFIHNVKIEGSKMIGITQVSSSLSGNIFYS